jgi:hypothetical protein
LIAALTVLGRLGGNIAGIATGRGPAGEMLREEAGQQTEQLSREKLAKTKAAQDFQGKMEEYREKQRLSKQVLKMSDKETDPQLRGMTQFMAAQGMHKEAVSLLSAAQKDRMTFERQLKIYQEKEGIKDDNAAILKHLWESKIDLGNKEEVGVALDSIGVSPTMRDKVAKQVDKLIDKPWFFGKPTLKAEAKGALEKIYGPQGTKEELTPLRNKQTGKIGWFDKSGKLVRTE